jgi:ADP-ribose pyrophosphatase YjhB (NUDIX family)
MSHEPHCVTSFGVICYRLRYDLRHNCVFPEYLMVQRKDSICFVEFIRGKYETSDKHYISQLIHGMTQQEHEKLGKQTFDEMWDYMWHTNRRMHSEYFTSREKFTHVVEGVESRDGEMFTLASLLKASPSVSLEPEWEFPKGRRNGMEDNLQCALREFEEETGVQRSKIEVVDPHRYVSLSKQGINGVMYKTILYMAKCKQRIDQSSLSTLNEMQRREVRSVRWLNFTDVCSRLRTDQQVKTFERCNKNLLISIAGIFPEFL